MTFIIDAEAQRTIGNEKAKFIFHAYFHFKIRKSVNKAKFDINTEDCVCSVCPRKWGKMPTELKVELLLGLQ